jgi:cytochrome c-type biogenesis protein CcmF
VGPYEIEYLRPTGDIDLGSAGGLEKIDLGADVRLRRAGASDMLLHTERSFFPSSDPALGAVSRYFEGEATSEVGLRAGFRRDVWTVVAPDVRSLRPVIERGDRVFAEATSLPEEMRAAALGEGLRRLVALYREDAPPATFRVLVSPLVSWIWLGALIVVLGGLLALWPAPRGARRRVSAVRTPAVEPSTELERA